MPNERYAQTVSDAEVRLLRFLTTLEHIQENMGAERLGEFQDRLREAAFGLFTTVPTELSQHGPPEPLTRFHDTLLAAIRHCGNAAEAFLNASEQDLSVASLSSRRSLCRGLNLLYDIRADLPVLWDYWLLPEAMADREALEATAASVEVPVGIIHNKRSGRQADYSLYVPENYDPQRQWPLVICLHGAYGRGDHYIWSWLRPAKSKGYILLAPKSVDVTWSILRPEIDIGSVSNIFEEVCGAYSIDRERVFLSGLSDGGTFTYLFGLSRPEMFAGIAPVAGDFHGMMDDMVRQGQGKELPIYIVHGAHDHIFPVDSIRQGHALLTRLGYDAKYEELPDWGHSYCATINAELVTPWLEGLTPKA